MIASRVVNAAAVVLLLLSLIMTSPEESRRRWGAEAFAPSVPRSMSTTAPRIGRTGEVQGTGSAFPRKISSSSISPPYSSTTTALPALLDVPDGFFAITFPVLGILLGISKSFARVRMEENAWEQRLAEGRAKLLAQNPSLTELDLRRMEAEREWSAYGAPRMQQQQQDEEMFQNQSKKRRGRGGVATADRPSGVMSMEEIEAFEATYGVEYDPYYDDPYAEDELPSGKFQVDKRYGDRVYEDGEIFYKTSDGLYYRQGAKPRSIQFW